MCFGEPYAGAAIGTSIDIKEGEKALVGRANLGGQALILALAARTIELGTII
jgi:hypothetical protein